MQPTLNDCFAAHHQLMPAEDALAQLRKHVRVSAGTEDCELSSAKGRILAEDLISPSAIPPFNNAAVDGYAFDANALKNNQDTTLPISAYITAGDPLPASLLAGTAVRIFTGAPLPEGANTVIMQEDVETPAGDNTNVVTIPSGLKTGTNWRPAGEDMQAGQCVLPKGHRLRPQDIGCAAAMGHASLRVYKTLKVAIFSTGNEIQNPGTALCEGGIYDVNRFMLATQVRQTGATVTDLGILPDDLESTVDALSLAATTHDIILTSGGVSTGDKDHISTAIEQLGEISFWRLAIKPGRPLAFGNIQGCPLIGFPGNPVATGVCFMRFGFPLVCALAGQTWPEPIQLTLPAAFSLNKKPGRTEWLRAKLKTDHNGQTLVDRHAKQGSGILTSLVEADGLIELGESVEHIETGDPVLFLPFSQFNVA